ncbi:MAG: peptide-methionine (S)-S-oxide reductase MsrA [Clostridia bacterium]|nr:peptide-methionine (S)-S-oxide reductase MsrA [Clostridia bacterium]
MKTIYLAGGCYWGVQKYIANIAGVIGTEVGFANGSLECPSYAQVKKGDTGHAETVRVDYDEARLPLTALLRLFFRIIDPCAVDQQGHDIGHQYRTGVYCTDPADEPVIRAALQELAARYTKPLAVECLPLACFYTAEEAHQQYLDKNPGGYCHVPWAEINWVKTVDPAAYA